MVDQPEHRMYWNKVDIPVKVEHYFEINQNIGCIETII